MGILGSQESWDYKVGRPPPGLSPAEALQQLRVADWYDIGSATLGSFDLVAVSLPPEGNRSVPLASLWGGGGKRSPRLR